MTGLQAQEKGGKRQKKDTSISVEPASKKKKTDTADVTEPQFSHVRFKFLLRSPETVVTG